MPPLTLEQVLARSMRLPKSRAKRTAAAALFAPARSGLLPPSSSPSTNGGGGAGAAAEAVRKRQQTLSFFDLVEREDDARTAGRLAISPSSPHLVRNSADLLALLTATRRLRAWEDGLSAFASASGLTGALAPLLATPAVSSGSSSGNTIDNSGISGSSGSSGAVPADGTVNPTADHVLVLLDTLAAGEQWPLMLRLAEFFGQQFPDAIVRAVTAVVQAREADDINSNINGSTAAATTTAAAPPGGQAPPRVPRALADAIAALSSGDDNRDGTTGYDAALRFLSHTTVAPGQVPVGCYNAILAGCEEARDWRAALRVVRAMGPNPLQGWSCPQEGEGVEAVPSAASSSPSSLEDSGASQPPPPDVVSYATLIAALEQGGQDAIAAQVLGRLPPVEKEEITASYAALIYVWSNQVYNKSRRRNR